MVREREVLRDLVVALRYVADLVIFRTIEYTRLESGVYLAVGHRCGRGSHRAHKRDENVGLLYADLLAFEIVRGSDGSIRVQVA